MINFNDYYQSRHCARKQNEQTVILKFNIQNRIVMLTASHCKNGWLAC